VRRCLEKKPEQRFQSAKDLAFALEAISGTTSSSKAVASAAAAPEKAQSRLLPWVLGAALGIVLASAAAWFLRPAPVEPPSFTRVLFDRAGITQARFAQDGKTVVFSGSLAGGALDTYVIRDDYPESTPAGFHGALLAAVSHTDQLALLVNPSHVLHAEFVGTLATVSLGGGAPHEILENVSEADWTPDGNEMAVLIGDSNARTMRMEFPIGKVVVPTSGHWMSGLRVSPDGQSVAYFHHPENDDDRGEVMIVDRSGKQTQLSAGWESLEGLAWSPSGKEVWFSAATSGEEYCIRAATLSGKVRTVYCGTSPTTIQDTLPNGKSLVSSLDMRASMELVLHGQSEGKDLSWLDNVYNPRLSRDGSIVSFTDQSSRGGNDYSVYVRKTDGSPAVKISSGEFASDMSPDGKSVLLFRADDPQQRAQIVPIGAGQPTTLHWDGFVPNWGDWFPDGQHILLLGSTSTDSTIRTYMTDRSGATPKLISKYNVAWPLASPDGHSIIVKKDGKEQILTIGEAEPREIPGSTPADSIIAWSDDPKVVYVQTVKGMTRTIEKLNVETGKRELWQVWNPKDPSGVQAQSVPTAITPDGSKMMFSQRRQLCTLYSSDNLK
jgi:eukaryotic-like serine/threonine-protein kinase